MVVRGDILLGPEERHEIFPDMGYSFCNCHNIFYTTHVDYGNPIEELRDAFAKLDIDNEYSIIMADPFFINWDNPYEFVHWRIRQNFVIWDIDSLCEVIEKIGFQVVGRYREFNENSTTPQTTTIILGREELTPRQSIQAAMDLFKDQKVTVVEIGTHTGRHAEMMLKHWSGIDKLYLVDLWTAYKDFPIQKWHDQDFDIVRSKFARNEKVKIIREDSMKAANQFTDGSLDFVYIDAAHDYDSVKKDVLAWMPKVKKGGIIAGHDYDYFNTPTVRQAIDEVFGVENIHTGKNFNTIQDWWIYL